MPATGIIADLIERNYKRDVIEDEGDVNELPEPRGQTRSDKAGLDSASRGVIKFSEKRGPYERIF